MFMAPAVIITDNPGHIAPENRTFPGLPYRMKTQGPRKCQTGNARQSFPADR